MESCCKKNCNVCEKFILTMVQNMKHYLLWVFLESSKGVKIECKYIDRSQQDDFTKGL